MPASHAATPRARGRARAAPQSRADGAAGFSALVAGQIAARSLPAILLCPFGDQALDPMIRSALENH